MCWLAWRGVPAFYLLMVAELVLKLKRSWVVCWCCVDFVSGKTYFIHTAHALHIYHQSETTSKTDSWIYLFPFFFLFIFDVSFIAFSLVNQNTHEYTHQKSFHRNWNIKVSLHCEHWTPQRAMQMDDMCCVLIIIVRVLWSNGGDNDDHHWFFVYIYYMCIIIIFHLLVCLFVCSVFSLSANAFVILCQKLFHFCFSILRNEMP